MAKNRGVTLYGESLYVFRDKETGGIYATTNLMGLCINTGISYWVLQRRFRLKGEVYYITDSVEIWVLPLHNVFKGKQRGNLENLQ